LDNGRTAGGFAEYGCAVDIDLKFGGTDGEIDLSSLKVEEFELDGGAGNYQAYIGRQTPFNKS